MENNYDASKRLLCKPWDGTHGAELPRRFASDFESALHTIQDKYASLTRSQATNQSEEKYVESERAYDLRSKKFFGLIRPYVTDPAIRQELDTYEHVDTIMRGNDKAAWQKVKTHGQPPHTGLTSIDDGNAWASLR
eukprot:6186450-Pleurochrysis_carterae.AAC.2